MAGLFKLTSLIWDYNVNRFSSQKSLLFAAEVVRDRKKSKSYVSSWSFSESDDKFKVELKKSKVIGPYPVNTFSLSKDSNRLAVSHGDVCTLLSLCNAHAGANFLFHRFKGGCR